jgi:hypothetical protein
MRISRLGLVLILIAAMPLAAFAAGPSRAKNVAPSAFTVGDFAVMLAAVTEDGRGLEAGKAVEALAKSGVPLGDPKLPLNERKMAEILKFYGVPAKSSSPDRLVSRARAESALLLVANRGPGKAGGATEKASTPIAPEADELEICLSEENTGHCVNCCKDLGGTPKRCADFCYQIKKESPSEPLP